MTSKSTTNSCRKMFLQVVVSDKFFRHFGKFTLPQWSFLVPLLIGNMELFLLFQNFPWEFSQIFETQKQLPSGALQTQLFCKKMWYDVFIAHLLSRITRCESYELLVTGSMLKNTSWNSKVRVQIHEFNLVSYEFKSTSCEFKFTSYKFISTSYTSSDPRVQESFNQWKLK